jgi:hypothetical protein
LPISLAGFAAFCETSPLNTQWCREAFNLYRAWLHSNRRNVWLAAVVALPILAGGCAVWDRNHWNLDHFRDERAVEIEQRLERTEPIVKNPF